MRSHFATRVVMATFMSGLIACGADGPDNGLIDELESAESAATEWRTQTLASTLDSPHPYANNTSIERRVEAPAGATKIRVALRIRTEQNYDFVEFLDGARNVVQRFSGAGEGLSGEIAGRVAIVRLTSDGSVTDWGFSITEFRYQIDTGSTPPPPPPTGGNWVSTTVTNIETPHPYRNNMNESWTVRAASNAQKIRIHFSGFDTETGYDFVRLFDASGREVAKLDGAKGGFVSAELTGSSARIQFTSDYSVTRSGFVVTKYEALMPSGGGGGGGPTPSCRRDSDCSGSQVCRSGQCVSAPTSGRAALGEACHSSNAPCTSGLECHAEQNSTLGGVCAEATWSRDDLPFPKSTDHPYKNDSDLRYAVAGPTWADRIRVVFDNFATEANYDTATVEVGGNQLRSYSGSQGTLQSVEVNGHQAIVHFKSDSSVTAHGFDLERIDVFGVPDGLVAISLDPRRCASSRLPTDTPALTAHLANMGITLYGVRRYTFATNTCTACSCPTGERIVMLVNAKDAVDAKSISSYTGVFSVQGNDVVFEDNLVPMRITPKQCRNNPWDQNSSADPNTRLMRWADGIGVEVFAAFQQSMRENTCAACSCPTTYDMHIAVPTDRVSTMERYGFNIVR